jgi:hypothetical protein
MTYMKGRCIQAVVVALVLAISLVCPPASLAASIVVGDASAARVTVLGLLGAATTTALADTGTLSGTTDARDASLDTGSIPETLSAETLSSSTIGWADQVSSEASLANVNMTLAGVGISADLVMAQASQSIGAAGTGTSNISNLVINGTPVNLTGAPNQTIWIPGGSITINEQTVSSTGTIVVNAIHVVISGVADAVIGSATAGIS